MSFKPASNQQPQDDNYVKVDWNAINKQVKGGSRPARISLIVDLGVQERDPFEEEYQETNPKHVKGLAEQGAVLAEVDGKTVIQIPQKPQPQVAVFVDLTSDVVDYGGEIGKQPYRLLLNKSFMGDVAGIGFAGCYSFDKAGQILKDKGFTFHSNSLLTKLAKATKQTQIVAGSGVDNMDVSQLLGQPLMVTVDKTETTDGKVYLNFKGCSEVPMIPSDPSDPDSKEIMMTVKPLVSPALTITFDSVKAEDKKWLRGDLVKKIKAANNYQGSAIQKVIEAKVDKVDDLPQESADTDFDAGQDDGSDIPF
jgi:hypothetical protein